MVAMISGKFYETGIPISIDELTICLRTIVGQSLHISFVEFLGQRSEQHEDLPKSDLLIFQSDPKIILRR
jgi:hypothetical protein